MDNKENIAIVSIFEKFGRYQLFQYFLICLPVAFVSMNMVNYVFVAGDIGFRCLVPECDDKNPTYKVSWWPSDITDKCSKPTFNGYDGKSCTNRSLTKSSLPCTQWVYESNETIIGELNLACQPWRVNSIGMIHNFGMALSMVITGWLSDKFGRKPVFITCSVSCVIGNLKTLTTSYNSYVCFEFLEALFSGGAHTAGNVMMLEIAGNHRVLAGVIFAYALYLGEAVFACLAMLFKYWKTLLYFLCSPAVAFLSYVFLVKESPRWQILNGRISSAKKTLIMIAKMNKIDISVENFNNMNEENLKILLIGESKETKEGYKDILKCKAILTNIGVAFFCRFAVSFIYFGLIVTSVRLPGNKYINFMLAACMSFPGELISMYFMNRIGRKLPLTIGFMICGAACIGCGIVPNDRTGIKVTLFLIGKLVTAACYTGLVTYTMELFPTSVRGSLIGLCTLAASGGTMLAPLTLILSSKSMVLSSLCFACTALVASILITLTPETRNLPLIDTIEQLKNLPRQNYNNQNI